MRLYAGTSGFSFDAWKGSFYPEGTRKGDMLAAYAARLAAVEVNNTFYRMPRADVLARWATQTPPHFRFVVKAPRRITHVRRLVDAQEETGHFLRTLDALGDRLGGVLFQLPPFLRVDVERLTYFQATLPAELRATFEFRHASWMTEAVYAALRRAGHALCCNDDAEEAPAVTGPRLTLAGDADAAATHTSPGKPAAPGTDAAPETHTAPEMHAAVATVPAAGTAAAAETKPAPGARHAYLRLRRTHYTDAALRAWLSRLRGSGVDAAYVFFKHEDEATGPHLALRLRRLFDEDAA